MWINDLARNGRWDAMTASDSETSDTGTPSADAYHRLIEIGIALSVERNHAHLMETILLEAKRLCNADGGTLYMMTEEQHLKFELMHTDSLGIAMGGTTGKKISFPPLPLFDAKTGAPNHKNVAAHVALTGDTVNIADAYEAEGFDFSGTKKFDESTGFLSTSFLTVPLKNHDGDVIGVLQLLNAQDNKAKVIPFGDDLQPLIEALASQAAVALDNQHLIAAQRRLLDSFIELIASAIDAKSPYTGGHCQRVPELTKMLVRAACDSQEMPFKDFDLTEDQWYELHIAAWLHDCGKVTTPEYVVDKATKLETIYDRLHEVRMRFEVVKRDAEITYLKALQDSTNDPAQLKADFDAQIAQIDDDFAFIAECNVGGEFMAPERVERVKRIAATTWLRTLDDRIGLSYDETQRMERTPKPALPVVEALLSDKPEHIIERTDADRMPADNPWGFKLEIPENKFNLGEVYNLSIGRGTLNAEERYKINDHMVQTIVMLEQLPFPKQLKRVPEIAGGHHEKMDGTGYPKRLAKEDMSIPARIMAIADIFEALTASDRPYKKAKTLSESLKIMSFMNKDQHIDPELFRLFLTSGVFREYAEKFLDPAQIDDVDITQYLPADAGTAAE
jgi:HD-GYP domain-containing protein (c-di-GMP phosphodiesterase class II)